GRGGEIHASPAATTVTDVADLPPNHASQIMAADFFVVPTVTYRLLFVFVILSHERRRLVHVAVTAHPTAAWTAQQLREAFPDEEAPRFLLHDRDSPSGPSGQRSTASAFARSVLRRGRRGTTATLIASSDPSVANASIMSSCSTSPACGGSYTSTWTTITAHVLTSASIKRRLLSDPLRNADQLSQSHRSADSITVTIAARRNRSLIDSHP